MRLTGKLKVYADQRRHPTVLLGDIQTHLLRESAKPDTSRRTDIIHPSELASADWCRRAVYYRIAGVPSDSDEPFSFRRQNVFAEGHSIHHKWQTWLREMGLLWGNWTCLTCGRKFSNCLESDTEHGCYGNTNIDYDEVPLEHKPRRIAGHADGMIPAKNCLIEIKSIGLGTIRMDAPELLGPVQVHLDDHTIYDLARLWASLRRPFTAHLRQGNIYLFLAKTSGLNVDKIVYLYEFKATQETKEFTVRMSPTILAPLLEEADAVTSALDRHTTPDRSPDFAQDHRPCTTCAWAIRCWDTE